MDKRDRIKRLLWIIFPIFLLAYILGVSVYNRLHLFEYYITENNEAVITRYKGDNGHVNTRGNGYVTVPAELDGAPVVAIGEYAFEDKLIVEITLPETLKWIADRAFCDCWKLEKVNMPESVEYIGAMAFARTPFEAAFGEQDIIFHNKVLYRYSGQESTVIIPENIVCIGGYGFAGSNVSEVVIPNSVKYIGDYTFGGCEELKSISLPDGVEYVGNRAFGGCDSLEMANVPGSVKTLGNGIFENCTALNEVNLGELAEITNAMFSGCSSLKKIDLPESVRTIGKRAFARSGLEEIVLPIGLREIETETFQECAGLRKVVLGANVQKIGEHAFQSCTVLEEVNFPEGLTEICKYAFADSGIQRVILPDTVTVIGEMAFLRCEELAELQYSGGCNTIPYSCFEGCSSLEELILPEGVEAIQSGAFQYADSLKQVTLPDGLKVLELNAFYDTQVSIVFIPDSVEEFNRQAFLTKCAPCTLLYTENCKGYQDLYDATHWRVWNDYSMRVVEDRAEAERYLELHLK